MGGGLSQLSADDIAELKKDTPFDEEDLKRILGRYTDYDSSQKGKNGIETDIVLTMPELAMNPLMVRLIQLVRDKKTNKVYPKGFIKFFGVLSSKTPIATKKKVAFRCFDLSGTGCLRLEELFQVYKLILDNAIDDDQLLRMVSSTLEHPSLSTPGEITFSEFAKIVPDFEMQSKFTLDL